MSNSNTDDVVSTVSTDDVVSDEVLATLSRADLEAMLAGINEEIASTERQIDEFDNTVGQYVNEGNQSLDKIEREMTENELGSQQEGEAAGLESIRGVIGNLNQQDLNQQDLNQQDLNQQD